jgi:choline-sulfatase
MDLTDHRTGDSRRPNLLHIVSDQHCPFVTGCYGDPLVETPHLDGLAAEGVTMDAAYCPSPICGPSRMAMLTGLHPFQNRSWTNRDILDSSIPTMAHALGAAGYRPVLIGRLHSMGPDQRRGYAERLVGDHSPNYTGAGPVANRGALDGTAGPDHVSLAMSGAGQSGYEVHDEEVTDAAVRYLRLQGERRRANPEAEPFCLTVGLMLPHPPYVARAADYGRYANRITAPRKPEFPCRDVPHYLRWWREHTGLTRTTEAETQRSRAAYWALVTSMDRMIGHILAALRAAGLEDNTLIVYTSDHGDMLGEHGMFWKHTFYEESARVPLIMAWPGTIRAGTRSGRVASALDVTATILDATGAPALPGSPGRSLLPPLDGASWTDEAFSEYCSDEAWGPPDGCFQRMIRCDEWKLTCYHAPGSSTDLQLFNLKEDPGELVNRAADRGCRDTVRDLHARLLADWDPEQVRAQMAANRARHQIHRGWARATQPHSEHLWDLRGDMFYLDPA